MPFTWRVTGFVSMKISDSSDESDGDATAGFWNSTKRSISLGDSIRGRGLDFTDALKPATEICSMMVSTVIR